eukprot:SM000172S03087  [mRNA]  locus=s172:264489:266287:- [translate_table: standard]
MRRRAPRALPAAAARAPDAAGAGARLLRQHLLPPVQATEDEGLWRMACLMTWPSMDAANVELHVRASGGYRRYYRLRMSGASGSLQVGLSVGALAAFLSQLFFLVDVEYRQRAMYSRKVDRADLLLVEEKEALILRLPDQQVGVTLVQGANGLSGRRWLERGIRDLRLSCVAVHMGQHKFLDVMAGVGMHQGKVGSNVFVTFQTTFLLPGLFQHSMLHVDVILTVSALVKALRPEEKEDGEEGVTLELVLRQAGLQVKAEPAQHSRTRLRRLAAVDPAREMKWL